MHTLSILSSAEEMAQKFPGLSIKRSGRWAAKSTVLSFGGVRCG